MEGRTDKERSNANMNSLVENQVNADAPLLAKLDEIRSLLAQSGRADAMTKCDELRALVTPPAVPVRDKDIGDAAGDQALDGWAGAAAGDLDGLDDDVLFEIISCLRTHEVIQIGAASRRLRAMTMKETVWEQRLPFAVVEANVTYSLEMYGLGVLGSKLNAAVCAELVTLGCSPRRLCLQSLYWRRARCRRNHTGLPPLHITSGFLTEENFDETRRADGQYDEDYAVLFAGAPRRPPRGLCLIAQENFLICDIVQREDSGVFGMASTVTKTQKIVRFADCTLPDSSYRSPVPLEFCDNTYRLSIPLDLELTHPVNPEHSCDRDLSLHAVVDGIFVPVVHLTLESCINELSSQEHRAASGLFGPYQDDADEYALISLQDVVTLVGDEANRNVLRSIEICMTPQEEITDSFIEDVHSFYENPSAHWQVLGNEDPWGRSSHQYFIRRVDIKRCTESVHDFFRLRAAGIRSWNGREDESVLRPY